MEKGIILGWLSVIHWHRNAHGLRYPDAPALGRLIQCSNRFDWNDRCYLEVLELGQASGLPFCEYLSELSPTLGRPGGTAANPILIDDNLPRSARVSPVSVKKEIHMEPKHAGGLGFGGRTWSTAVLVQGRGRKRSYQEGMSVHCEKDDTCYAPVVTEIQGAPLKKSTTTDEDGAEPDRHDVGIENGQQC